jgi:hypothetical protein
MVEEAVSSCPCTGLRGQPRGPCVCSECTAGSDLGLLWTLTPALLQMVTEFFGYAVNSILYQRGIYPPENFQGVQKCPPRTLTSRSRAPAR